MSDYKARPSKSERKNVTKEEYDSRDSVAPKWPDNTKGDDALMYECFGLTGDTDRRYECSVEIVDRMLAMLKRCGYPKGVARAIKKQYRRLALDYGRPLIDVRDPLTAWRFLVQSSPACSDDNVLRELEEAFRPKFDANRASLLPTALRSGAIATTARLLNYSLARSDARIDRDSIFEIVRRGHTDMLRWLDYYHQDIRAAAGRWQSLLQRTDLGDNVLTCILIVAYRLTDAELAALLGRPSLSPAVRRNFEIAYGHPVRRYNHAHSAQ